MYPRYQVFRVEPLFCPITDGMIGNSISAVDEMAYSSLMLAKKIAARLSEKESDNFGDCFFYAGTLDGKRVLQDRVFDQYEDVEIPF